MDGDASEVENQVIAVQPFYRGRAHAVKSEIPSSWETYFSVPGNFGLAYGGGVSGGPVDAGARDAPAAGIRSDPRARGVALRTCGEGDRQEAGDSICGLGARAGRVFGNAGWACGAGVVPASFGAECIGRRSAVICISEKVRERLGREFSEKAEVIYNGVDEEMFRPGAELKSRARS